MNKRMLNGKVGLTFSWVLSTCDADCTWVAAITAVFCVWLIRDMCGRVTAISSCVAGPGAIRLPPNLSSQNGDNGSTILFILPLWHTFQTLAQWWLQSHWYCFIFSPHLVNVSETVVKSSYCDKPLLPTSHYDQCVVVVGRYTFNLILGGWFCGDCIAISIDAYCCCMSNPSWFSEAMAGPPMNTLVTFFVFYPFELISA